MSDRPDTLTIKILRKDAVLLGALLRQMRYSTDPPLAAEMMDRVTVTLQRAMAR